MRRGQRQGQAVQAKLWAAELCPGMQILLQCGVCVYVCPAPQAPSVDLQALTQHLEETHLQVDEQVGGQGADVQVVGNAGARISSQQWGQQWGQQRGQQRGQQWGPVLHAMLLPSLSFLSCHSSLLLLLPLMLLLLGVTPPPLLLSLIPPTLQASIVAALSSDLNKVQQLVEQASEQLGADPAASVQVGARPGRAVVQTPSCWADCLQRLPVCPQRCLLIAFAAWSPCGSLFLRRCRTLCTCWRRCTRRMWGTSSRGCRPATRQWRPLRGSAWSARWVARAWGLFCGGWSDTGQLQVWGLAAWDWD
jgi:ferredoxin